VYSTPTVGAQMGRACSSGPRSEMMEVTDVKGGGIQTKGYGKENPVADNKTDEGRERNRRVELHILN